MPTPRRPIDPRSLFGFTGSPLALPAENVPMTQQMRDRFQRTGNEAFVPYLDPWATLAQSQDYQAQGQEMAIQDAEQAFVNELPNLTANPTGFQEFLSRNPSAQLSPMVRVYQKSFMPSQTKRDPYEAMVAKEGADYLEAYRGAVQGGQDPIAAFAEFRDVIQKEKPKGQATEDDELWFVKEGGDLEEYGTLKKQGASRAKMLDYINKKGRPLNTTESSKLSTLQQEVADAEALMQYDDNEEYVEEAIAAYGRKPANDKEWEEAYYKLKEKKVGPKKKALDDYLDLLKEQNKRLPGQAPKAGLPPSPMPTVPRGTSGTSPLSEIRNALKP